MSDTLLRSFEGTRSKQSIATAQLLAADRVASRVGAAACGGVLADNVASRLLCQ